MGHGVSTTEVQADGKVRQRYLSDSFTPDRAKERLAAEVRSWIELADMRPVLAWDSKRSLLAPRFAPGGLFGHLAMELLLAVSRADRTQLCAGSDHASQGLHWFAPRHASRRFCDQCRKLNIPDLIRMRRKRARDRDPR